MPSAETEGPRHCLSRLSFPSFLLYLSSTRFGSTSGGGPWGSHHLVSHTLPALGMTAVEGIDLWLVHVMMSLWR